MIFFLRINYASTVDVPWIAASLLYKLLTKVSILLFIAFIEYQAGDALNGEG